MRPSSRGSAHAVAVTVLSLLLPLAACDDNDDTENAGAACETPDECYPDVDHDALLGDVACLDRVEGGYCTHFCTSDTDCCAVEGECETGINQVCAPLESTGTYQCFLSCEHEDVGDMDSTAYCQEYAHPAFGCRSTGGGADNRRVCLP